MKRFFRENKTILAIVIGALIIGAALYFGLQKGSDIRLGGGNEIASEAGECLAPEKAIVTKVLDGDTIIIEGGQHIRLLGIDADESGYPCYEPAKSRLEELILNKEVSIEKDQTDVDQYGRCLRYIFLEEQNIDLQLVKEGLAIVRFYPPDVKYQKEITQAEENAIKDKVGCKWGQGGAVAGEKNNEFQWQELTTEKLGYDVMGACQTGKYLGSELIVEGKVADAYRDTKSNTVFLNFEKPYPNQCFTGVIFSSDLYKFVQNPEDYYSGKIVRAVGEIKEYQGRPEIILQNPNQIEVAND